MFEDFLNLNYWKTKNKLRLLRDLINRINVPKLEESVALLSNTIDRLDKVVQAKYEYRYRARVEEEEELLPDLIIKSIIPTEHDDYIDFAITVKNQGEFIAESNLLNVSIPDHSDIDLTIPQLDINEEITLYHQFSFDSSGAEIQRTIVARADYNNIIVESNEDNNSKSLTFTAKETYTPPVGKAYIITHLHNPEGKEIGSISGVSGAGVSPGTVAINEATHGVPNEVTPGNITITAQFNGITLEQNIDIAEGEVREIFFIFPRTEYIFGFNFEENFSDIGQLTGASASYNETEDADPWSWHRLVSYSTGDSNTILDYIFSGECNLSPSNFSVDCDLEYDMNVTPYYGFISLRFESESFNYITSLSLPPTRSDFTSWYVQSFISGVYPQLYWQLPGSDFTFFNDGETPRIPHQGFHIRTFLASRSVESLYARSDISLTRAGIGDISGSKFGSDSVSNSGTASMKMSSTPYDIEGTAV